MDPMTTFIVGAAVSKAVKEGTAKVLEETATNRESGTARAEAFKAAYTAFDATLAGLGGLYGANLNAFGTMDTACLLDPSVFAAGDFLAGSNACAYQSGAPYNLPGGDFVTGAMAAMEQYSNALSSTYGMFNTTSPGNPAAHTSVPYMYQGGNGAHPRPPHYTPAVHNSVRCNSCGKIGIVGNRYKCHTCRDYDLCEWCYSRNFHDLSHSFIKYRYEGDNGTYLRPRRHARAVHARAQCNVCRKIGIVGNRYKCNTCPDYDLCEWCYFHSFRHTSHPFIKYKYDGGPGTHLQPRCSGG